MHFGGRLPGFAAQFRRQSDHFPPVRLGVKQCGGLNPADKHLLQRHALRTELKPVRVALLAVPVLVFHRHGLPSALPALQTNPFRVGAEFHNVADSAESQLTADHPHPPHNQQIAPFLHLGLVMTALVVQLPLCGAGVFRPLLLQMNECPLPPTKKKMLNS